MDANIISGIIGVIGIIIGAWVTYGFERWKEKKKQQDEEKQKKRLLQTEEDRYLDFVINANEKLTFHGFEASGPRVPVLLWNVYVSLRTNMTGLRESEFENRMDSEAFRQDTTRDISVQEAVKIASEKRYDGLIILGDPGAGKTTLLKYFLLCFAKKEAVARLNLPSNLLPILLPLRSVNMKMTFVEAILDQLKDFDLRISADFFRQRLEQGQAIVLLDGLDEVANESERKKMCQWIHNAHNSFNKCPFIITSRFAGYRGEVRLPGAYLELHIQDFDKEEIHRFLHSWYTAVETSLHEDSNYWRTIAQQSAEELYHRIESTEAYLKLATNPLMLQLIALVHYDFKTVPDRRVELYKKCLELLLQKWDEAKGLKTLLSAEEARQVLQPLALWMHSETGRTRASKIEVVNQIQSLIQQIRREVDVEKFLTSIRDRSGVFVGFGTETYGFQHHSFQEYLTAEEIRNKNKIELLIKYFDESWWREVTLLALGLSNPSIFEPFMTEFMASDKNNGASADFMLKCVGEAIIKSEEPFEKCLKNTQLDWQAHYNALLCLKEIVSDAAKKAVEVALKDNHPKVANFARELLIEWNLIEPEPPEEIEPITGLPKRIVNPLEDNAEYLLIPAGSYKMGETGKQIEVRPFYLAKFPVTNRLYRKFVEATNYKKPHYWNEKRFNGNDQPVVGVSWSNAKAYCHWLTENSKDGKIYRLPKEEEWEWAAGGGKREYPWGDETINKSKANYANNVGCTTPVGNYPAGATPEGVMDMAGNVWEWTDSWYDETKSICVVRGGAWYDSAYGCRVSYRNRCSPEGTGSDVGFRCCQDFLK